MHQAAMMPLHVASHATLLNTLQHNTLRSLSTSSNLIYTLHNHAPSNTVPHMHSRLKQSAGTSQCGSKLQLSMWSLVLKAGPTP